MWWSASIGWVISIVMGTRSPFAVTTGRRITGK
jgi:hypothetical protein